MQMISATLVTEIKIYNNEFTRMYSRLVEHWYADFASKGMAIYELVCLWFAFWYACAWYNFIWTDECSNHGIISLYLINSMLIILHYPFLSFLILSFMILLSLHYSWLHSFPSSNRSHKILIHGFSLFLLKALIN